jgi:FixJ family two-component response regulator
LLDVRVPGVSGTELADEILSIRPNIPVLWMSGFVDDEIIRVKLLDEYAGFLSKPFHGDDLLLAARQAIEAARSSASTLGHPGKNALTAGARA